MPVLTLAQSEDLVVRTLMRCRTSEANAQSVARALVAGRSGWSQGSRPVALPSYAAQAKVGKVDGFATPAMNKPKPSVVAVDAAHGFAYPAIEAALSELPAVARAQGVAAAAIRRSHHCGAAGHPVERLAESGAGRADVRQHAGRDRALGRIEGGVRHQPDRLRLSASGPRADRGRPVAVQDGARQHHGRRSSVARKSPKAGRWTSRAGRQPIRTRPCAAPCCRSATPRARRWR